ncbi:hypothetical protein UlMin_022431 [Ulmus minor]
MGLASSVAKVVVSAIAFQPPKPAHYKLFSDRRTGKYYLDVYPYLNENINIMRLRTRIGTSIVAAYFSHPMATTTVLYSHGNGYDLGDIFSRLVAISSQMRVNIMAYDYSGYGQSTGLASEENTYADIDAALKCLEGIYGARREDIILYGRSIGTGPTVDLAYRTPRLKAVVLQSPMLSGFRLLCPSNETYWFDIYKVFVYNSFLRHHQQNNFFSTLLHLIMLIIILQNVEKVPLIDCPVLVIHGTSDQVIPFAHGKRIYSLCKNKLPPLWIEGGHHDDLFDYPELLAHLRKGLYAVERRPSIWNGNFIRSKLYESDPCFFPDSF